MNYYKAIYYKGESPNGKGYLFKSPDEYKHGDVVELPHRKKGMISAVIQEEEVDYALEEIQSIVGKWEEKDGE